MRAEQRNERELVDGERHLPRLHDRALERSGRDVEFAYRLAVRLRTRLLEVADDHCAHALGDAVEARAGPVQAHVPHDHTRTAHQNRSGHNECGRRRIPWLDDVVELELVHLSHGDAEPFALEGTVRGASPLGVVGLMNPR